MKLYRNVITVEVLSDRELTDSDTEDLAYLHFLIDHGGCSGKVHHAIVNEEVTKLHMAKLLEAQGSDPSFLLGEGLKFWPEGSSVEDMRNNESTPQAGMILARYGRDVVEVIGWNLEDPDEPTNTIKLPNGTELEVPSDELSSPGGLV